MVTAEKKGVMETFEWAYKNRHEYAKDLKKRSGKKLMGYFCTYMPEELMYAAGIVPIRVMGSHEPQDLTEKHIYSMYCPFCRDCLAQGLAGRYDYLDGITMAHSCIHIRQTYGSWVLHVPVSYNYYLSMPAKVQSPAARPFLVGELKYFKKSLEEWTGKPISDESISEAIELYNTNRRLMKQVYELSKAEVPPVTGLERMFMVLASQMMDKKDHNELLKTLLEKELPQRKVTRDPGIRLIIIGSEDDDTEFLRMTENMGATIVVDEHCTGTRYFWNEAPRTGDNLDDIAVRYLQKPPCPQKDWEVRRRWPHILQLVDDWKVQGALVIQQKFCDPHEFDIPPMMALLKEKRSIPSLFLEFDVTVPSGQFRTRVEAFLEMLQMEIL